MWRWVENGGIQTPRRLAFGDCDCFRFRVAKRVVLLAASVHTDIHEQREKNKKSDWDSNANR